MCVSEWVRVSDNRYVRTNENDFQTTDEIFINDTTCFLHVLSQTFWNVEISNSQ